MLNLQVFKIIDGIEKNWDDVDFSTECEIVATIEGETNQECESKAIEEGYGDTDLYGWTYHETL